MSRGPGRPRKNDKPEEIIQVDPIDSSQVIPEQVQESVVESDMSKVPSKYHKFSKETK